LSWTLRRRHQSRHRRPCRTEIPTNISLLPLPPRSPELNSQENIWQFMRQNWLSNRIFKSFDDIVDHCCYAWNTLIDQPWKIMSIALRDWASVGQ
jgi:transposase